MHWRRYRHPRPAAGRCESDAIEINCKHLSPHSHTRRLNAQTTHLPVSPFNHHVFHYQTIIFVLKIKSSSTSRYVDDRRSVQRQSGIRCWPSRQKLLRWHLDFRCKLNEHMLGRRRRRARVTLRRRRWETPFIWPTWLHSGTRLSRCMARCSRGQDQEDGRRNASWIN